MNFPSLVPSANQYVAVNKVFALIDALLFTPPNLILSPPSNNGAYLVGNGATGTLSGHGGDIALKLATLEFFTPPDGTVIGSYTKFGLDWVQNQFVDGATLYFNASASVAVPPIFKGRLFIVADGVSIQLTQGPSNVTVNSTTKLLYCTGLSIVS